MSIFDAPARRRPVVGKTPAHTLYNYWLSVLEGMNGPFVTPEKGRAPAGYGMSFGNRGNHYLHATSSDERGRPILNMAGLELRANGEFRVPYMRGWKRRNDLEVHTFLGYTVYKSRPQWFVDLSFEVKGYWGERLNPGAEWDVEHHYIDEHLMTKSNYYFVPPWLKLEQGALNWEIHFSRPHENLAAFKSRPSYADHTSSTQETFDWYARLREKRRRGEQREQDIREGHIVRGEKTYRSAAEIEAEKQDALQLIVANMTAVMPARTVPLRKTVKEEGLWPEHLGTG